MRTHDDFCPVQVLEALAEGHSRPQALWHVSLWYHPACSPRNTGPAILLGLPEQNTIIPAQLQWRWLADRGNQGMGPFLEHGLRKLADIDELQQTLRQRSSSNFRLKLSFHSGLSTRPLCRHKHSYDLQLKKEKRQHIYMYPGTFKINTEKVWQTFVFTIYLCFL